jgi:hypothetical protein
MNKDRTPKEGSENEAKSITPMGKTKIKIGTG